MTLYIPPLPQAVGPTSTPSTPNPSAPSQRETPPDDPTWYIKQAISPTSLKAKQLAKTANPVVFVDTPTETLGSLIRSTIVFAIFALGMTALTIWIFFLCIHSMSIAGTIFLSILGVAISAALIWATINSVKDIFIQSPRYIAIGPHGIEVWQKKRHVDLPWTDVQACRVRIGCTRVTSRHTSTVIVEPKIQLTLTENRLKSLPRSHDALLMRITFQDKKSATYNAIINLFSLKDDAPGQAASAFIANIALSRFAPNNCQPMDIDPLPVVMH